MRFEGRLKSWNDERGYGFIEPALGGANIFVHIKSFENPSLRPVPGQALSFEVVSTADGKPRAQHVRPPGATLLATWARASSRSGRTTSPQRAGWLAIPAFGLLYLTVALVWGVPWWVAGVYAFASVACFIAYAVDKSAARGQRWRVSESTLLTVGLVGGWPGAIAAQQWLRHKSSKAEFRAAFWRSVALNVVAFTVLHSPLLPWLLPRLAGWVLRP